jgi:putative pyruvate formate lyase activating enzyme
VAVSVMSQYYPAHKARKYQGLNRKITPEEYAAVAALVEELGIENGWMQGMAAADSYRPDFNAAEPFKEGRHKKRERRKRKERRK